MNEPILIDIEEIGNTHVTQKEEVEEDEHAWIYIMVGVLLGVGIMTVAGVLAYMYKTKKGCWSNDGKVNKTMPINLTASMKKR